MAYVIKRTDQGGGYVAPPGSKHSFTRNIAQAMAYVRREDAERNRCCENEVVVDRESEMEVAR